MQSMDGFINFFKEPGITSNHALKKIKKITGCKKAGFLGTLDPDASGILPVALGKGTKLFPYFEKMPKKYRATIAFGSETDTQDATGKVTKEGATDHLTQEKVEAALEHFTGEIGQVPPMYSAKRINGKRLYEVAREGGVVEREEKKVTVHSIRLEEFGGDRATFRAVVSQGTYIRTLSEDIGRHLDCPAHMESLTREEVHLFKIENSWKLDMLSDKRDSVSDWLLPMDFPLSFMPRIDVTQQDAKELSNGGQVQCTGGSDGTVRLYTPDGRFFGLGRIDTVVRKLLPEKILFPVTLKISAVS